MDDCATASNAPPKDRVKISINATRGRAIRTQNNTALAEALQMRTASVCLTMTRGGGVGVVAQGVGVPFGEDFHQPAIKIIDWVIHDRFEAAVVFSMEFFNFIYRSDAERFG